MRGRQNFTEKQYYIYRADKTLEFVASCAHRVAAYLHENAGSNANSMNKTIIHYHIKHEILVEMKYYICDNLKWKTNPQCIEATEQTIASHLVHKGFDYIYEDETETIINFK